MHADGAYRGRRLLLVEDDGELRSSLSELLLSDGYDVVQASNGSEALDRLRTTPTPDLILLDLMMPVKDGWQFRVEQKRDPALAAIPVVALSADDTPKAAAIDAEAYIRKPFLYPALAETVRRVLDMKKLAHLDRMASLGTLAAGIAHEINNPLTYVIANLQLLEEEIPRFVQDYVSVQQRIDPTAPLDDVPGAVHRLHEVAARLHDALEGAERIRGIVRHVKTFSRAGDDHRSHVDVRSVLDSSIKVVFSEIRQRAKLVKEYNHTPLVLANPGQLGQVFLNLLLNAAHAIEEEDPRKNTIQVTTRTTPTGEISIEISDTGRGIPPEVRDRIFDPFFTTKPLGIGTGLGLSICHGIVRSLNGTITVDSEIGRGTTFRIVLPPSTDPPPSARLTPTPVPQIRGRILVIDDEPQLAAAIRDMIGTGHDTVLATTGAEALTQLMQERDENRFDLILCDLHMPDISGMDLYDKLLELRPALAQRIVFMTGGAFTERSREFVNRVKNRCIDKPLDLHELRQLVATALVRRQS